jgi:methionyl-tRNA formyltransferase
VIILSRAGTPKIGREEYWPSKLSGRLAGKGAAHLVETLDQLARGTITPETQDDAHASLCADY